LSKTVLSTNAQVLTGGPSLFVGKCENTGVCRCVGCSSESQFVSRILRESRTSPSTTCAHRGPKIATALYMRFCNSKNASQGRTAFVTDYLAVSESSTFHCLPTGACLIDFPGSLIRKHIKLDPGDSPLFSSPPSPTTEVDTGL